MNLPVRIQVKQITKEMLFEAYRSKDVIAYCRGCSNYEKNYSCPDFSFDAAGYLEPYKYATVILTEVDSGPVQSRLSDLRAADFKSRVLDNYRKEAAKEPDLASVVSMHAFETVKNLMSEKLLELEKTVGESVGLPPGSCTRCAVCAKVEGKPCVFPEKLRYSLEALGFLVSEIYQRHFDRQLGWAKGELPERFCTCSVLMTQEKTDEGWLEEKLGDLSLDLDLH